MSEEFSPQNYYTRDEAMGILQITAMELGDLVSKGVLKGVSMQGKSYYSKTEVEYYFHCLENIDYIYEPYAQPYVESVYQGKAYSSLNTITLLGINEFELDFLIRSRLLIVFYRGFNWFFAKIQVDECVANIDLFRRDMEAGKRHSATRVRPANTFVWTKPDPKTLASMFNPEPPSTEDIQAAIKDVRLDEDVEEIPFEEPSKLMYNEEQIEVDEVLELLDIEEHELDLLIAEKSLKHYLENGVLVFHRVEVQRYFERLKTQNLVCAEENMEELFEALEDGVYSFRETRARLFLTEFQMELLERSGALTVFRKGIHRYFNRTRVDELEGDPNAFAQLIVNAKRAGLAKKKIKKKKVFPYTKHYLTRYANNQFISSDVFQEEVKDSPAKSTEKTNLTLAPVEEEIIEISPLVEVKTQPLLISPILEAEDTLDTSALLPPADTSALLPPEEEEANVELNIEEILHRAQEHIKIKPARFSLIPQTRGTTFTYTQTKTVLQMNAKEIQTLMQQGQLIQIPQKKSVHFEKEEVLALRQQITSIQIEEF